MKKIILFSLASCVGGLAFGQGQIGNADMELWENVQNSQSVTGEEPENWNSFLTASGPLENMGDTQIEQSSDVRPGSTGTKSARIWSRNAGFGIVANGNMTTGQVNMGSIIATSTDNHNHSVTADPNFSESLTDTPDSIVFWAKFTLGGGTAGNARMKATLHDNFDYQDPEVVGVDDIHVVATAIVNYPETSGWQRFAVPFTYTALPGNTHILVTFSTNEAPSQGNVDDQVWIDDVELIYNPAGLEDTDNNGMIVSLNNSTDVISVNAPFELDGEYAVYNTMGQKVQAGALSSEIPFDAKAGVYFVHVFANGRIHKFEVLKN